MSSAVVPLGEVAAINPDTLVDANPDDLCSFVPMSAVDEENANISDYTNRLYKEVAKGYVAFAERDVLLAKITPCMENGKCAIARGLRRGVGFGSTEFHVVRTSSRILPEWIYYYWRFPATRVLAERNMTGTAGQKRVPTSFLEALPIPLPSLDQQRQSLQSLQKADYLRRIRRHALQMMDELPLSAFLKMFGDPRANPKGWDQCTIEDVLEWSQYGTSQKSNTAGRGYPVLGMGNVTDSGQITLSPLAYVDLPADEFEQLKLQPGDVIFNRTNSTELVGKTACWRLQMDAVVASYLVRLRLKPSVNPEFFVSLLNTNHYKTLFRKRCKKAVNQSNISPTLLREFPMYLPPLELQKRFASLSAKHSQFRSVQLEVIRQADHLFQTLLHQAFSS
jgi:type I restriction enzyme, S subunit